MPQYFDVPKFDNRGIFSLHSGAELCYNQNMVCIAAFIILCLVGVFVAFLSIFRRDIGKKYWAVFKKSWGCVGKKVRLQKCETNFKDDVKNSLLSKVVLKHPKWVKPIGTFIEVFSIVIVFVTVWSLVEAVKAILALWVFGTCNVSQPASCALGAEVCGIDAREPRNPIEWTGRWFGEWGEIFANIPDRFHDWKVEDYLVEPYTYATDYQEGKPLAMDIFDPGCTVCLQSYRNQKNSGFFDEYNTVLMVYPIELPDGGYKFENSDIIAEYIHAANLLKTDYARRIIDKLYTEKDDKGTNYQIVFYGLSRDEAEKKLQSWLKDFGADKKQLAAITEKAHSDEVKQLMQQVKDMVENKIHAKGIPTLIYNGRKHNGLYKND